MIMTTKENNCILPDSKGYREHFKHEICDENCIDVVKDRPVPGMDNGEENDDDIHEDEEYRTDTERDVLGDHSHVEPKDTEK